MKTETPDGREVTRRSFLTSAIVGWFGVAGISILASVIQYLIPPAWRELAFRIMLPTKVSDIPLGQATIVKVEKKAIILVRTPENQVRALSAVCTHLGCIVEYRPEESHFKCNCHGSVFDMTGKNISGPAPRPLQAFRTQVKDDRITVSQS